MNSEWTTDEIAEEMEFQEENYEQMIDDHAGLYDYWESELRNTGEQNDR